MQQQKYTINQNPEPVSPNFLSWQIVDKEGNLICDFRGPMALMCCMAALERMNSEDYEMEEAVNIYGQYRKEPELEE